jgi:hypothetical protein
MNSSRFRRAFSTGTILAFSMALSTSAQVAQTVRAGKLIVLPDRLGTLATLQQQEFRQHGNGWSIDVKYPELTGAAHLNLVIRRKLDWMVKGFKRGLPSATADIMDYPDYGSYLTGTYKAQILKSGIVSILFDYSIYVNGAAHPGGELASLNYDPNTHRLLALSDMFRPKSPYLSRLSEIAIQSLEQNEYADNFAIHHGAGPVEGNFKVFTLTDKELVLHFQTYQVAAGAAGPQEVVIPLTSLTALLKQRYLPEP